jgi:DNA-binding transcriptional regulator YdaS (Cro superfamily)
VRIDQMSEGLRKAINAAGGVRSLARLLNINFQAIHRWQRVPSHRVLEIERLCKVPREDLRPDLRWLRQHTTVPLDVALRIVNEAGYRVSKPRIKKQKQEVRPALNAVGKPFGANYDPKYKMRSKPTSIGRLFASQRNIPFVSDGESANALKATVLAGERAAAVAAFAKQEEAAARGYARRACKSCGNFTLKHNGAGLRCDTCDDTHDAATQCALLPPVDTGNGQAPA